MSNEDKIAKAQAIVSSITKGLNDLVELLITDKATVEEQPVTEHKRKRRDPNAPKPPTSNFFLFTNSIRDEVEKENPEATFAEKSKIYGARWQKLSDEAKKPFSDQAKEERDRYNEELAAYEAKNGVEHPEKKVKKETPAKAKVATPTKAAAKTGAATPAKAATKTAAPAATPAKATKATTKAAKTAEKATKVTEKPAAESLKTAKATKPSKVVAKVTVATAKPTATKVTKKPVESSSDSDSDDSSSSSDSDSD